MDKLGSWSTIRQRTISVRRCHVMVMKEGVSNAVDVLVMGEGRPHGGRKMNIAHGWAKGIDGPTQSI